MTLDEEVLAQTKGIREQLLETERELEHLRADYHHAIRLLHARGGAMREIAEALSLSHQRVHQIVGGEPTEPGPGGHRGRPHGRGRGHGHRHALFGRMSDDAGRVVIRASAEARALAHGAVEAPHLLLALTEEGPVAPALAEAGARPDELRRRIETLYPQGPERRRGRMRFGRSAKDALGGAVEEATTSGDAGIESRHLVLGLTREGTPREELAPLELDLDRIRQAVTEEK